MRLLLFTLATLWLGSGPTFAGPDSTASEDCDCDPPADLLGGKEQVVPNRILPSPRLGSGPMQLELFVMSLCPYAMEAEQDLLPLVEQFDALATLEIYYIADEAGAAPKEPPPAAATTQAKRGGCAARSEGTGNGPFRSLHGQEEIDEARRQLIVLADHPERYRPYLLCRSRQGPSGAWRECAAATGLDPEGLQAEAAGPRGETLFRQNIRRANALGIHLSPTLYVDGEEFSGDLEPLAVARRLCHGRGDREECAQVPVCGSDADCTAPAGRFALCQEANTPKARCASFEPVPFELTVVQTAACRACSTEAFLGVTEELFPGARIRHLEAGAPEAIELIRQYGLEVFPAYIFSTDFARHPRFPRVAPMVRPAPGGFLLQPRVESLTYWSKRPRLPGHLDLFLPAWALDLEAGFLRQWSGDPGRVRVHPLMGKTGPRDAPEELVRRACLSAEQPIPYRAYVAGLEPGAKGAAAWEMTAREAGVDLARLARCLSSGRGQALLATSQAIADSLLLAPDNPAALVGNRLLARRVLPARLATLAKEEGNP